MTKTPEPRLGRRFRKAMKWALKLHATQTRKGTDIPYAAHLLAVTAIALEHGADEDEAIGALLHDAAEDQGGERVLERIREKFGKRVARIVRDCSDTFEEPKPPWRARKEQHVAHMRDAPASSRLVALADKVHNLRAMVRDYGQLGETLWMRFRSKSGDDVLWYYGEMRQALAGDGGDPRIASLLAELDLEIDALRRARAART